MDVVLSDVMRWFLGERVGSNTAFNSASKPMRECVG